MRTLLHYATLWRRIGRAEFQQAYGKPALIGVGMVGEVEADAEKSSSGTLFMAQVRAKPERSSIVGRTWLITKNLEANPGPAVTVGRSAYNDVVIPEYTVSAHHCQFRYEPGRLLLSDLGSTNGTHLNGQRLAPKEARRLRVNDKLVVGRYLFVFVDKAGFLTSVARLAA